MHKQIMIVHHILGTYNEPWSFFLPWSILIAITEQA